MGLLQTVAFSNSGNRDTRSDPMTKQVAGKLQRMFKSWDRYKDNSVEKVEVENFYKKLRGKPRRNQQGDKAGVPDPLAPLADLFAAIDRDKNDKIAHDEFDEWATGFIQYSSQYIQAHTVRAEIQQKLAAAEMRRDAVRTPRRITDSTAKILSDNLLDDLTNRLTNGYKSDIARLDKQLADLDAEHEHSAYRDFVFSQLQKR